MNGLDEGKGVMSPMHSSSENFRAFWKGESAQVGKLLGNRESGSSPDFKLGRMAPYCIAQLCGRGWKWVIDLLSHSWLPIFLGYWKRSFFTKVPIDILSFVYFFSPILDMHNPFFKTCVSESQGWKCENGCVHEFGTLNAHRDETRRRNSTGLLTLGLKPAPNEPQSSSDDRKSGSAYALGNCPIQISSGFNFLILSGSTG